MKNEKKHIGNLYKDAFKNAEREESDQDDKDWNVIAHRLDKKRFYLFSWTRFNIYYSSLIVITFLLLFLLLFKTYFSEDSHGRRPVLSDSTNLGIKLSDKSHAVDSTPLPENKNPVVTGNQIQIRTRRINTVDSSKNETNANQDSVQKAISAIPVYKAQDTSGKAPAQALPVRKPKKIVYITRQDTITVVDTLSTKKQRRRK